MTSTTPPVRTGEETPDHPFVLDSIASSVSPTDPGETDWHRYVINQGRNQIVGYRRGSADSVRQAVDLIIEQLNARRTIKAGRKHITIGTPNRG